MTEVMLHHGDCLSVMPTIASGAVDAIVTDPPYPCVAREYGEWTEAEWHGLMRGVVAECRRILKPSGSAVFILQPNSERFGRMRLWLWEFLIWAAREWNLIQDAYWWNTSTLPVGGVRAGLMRPSLKYAVWLGPEDAYRDQDAVLMEESASNIRDRTRKDFDRGRPPSRVRSETEGPLDDYRRMRTRCVDRGGVTPFNVLATGSSSPTSGGTLGHGAATPYVVMDWWVRYISPPGGVVLDPFVGSGTTLDVCARTGRTGIGIDKMAEYVETARRRLAGPPMPLFDEPAARPDPQPSLFSALSD